MFVGRQDLWKKVAWLSREDISLGAANIIKELLVDREKAILQPHYINETIRYVHGQRWRLLQIHQYIVSGLSIEKLKAGIFHGHQIRKLIMDSNFTKCMTGTEASAWCTLQFCLSCQERSRQPQSRQLLRTGAKL